MHPRSTHACAVGVPAIALLALALLGGGCGESSATKARRTSTDAVRSAQLEPRVPPRPARTEKHSLGRSHLGRPVEAVRLRGSALDGDDAHVLVVGCIHGTECAGIAVIRELIRRRDRADGDLWLVPNANPDGLAAGRRQNGRGVDLNRNFPSQWRALGVRWDPQYAGPRPASERETRILMRLVERIRPETTVWYHQYAGAEEFVRAWGPSIPAARRYARIAAVRFRQMPWPHGTAPNWQNHRFPGTSSFVVEFPPGPLSRATARRHAAAVLRLAGASADAERA